MSYESYESSRDGGQPVELYEFTLGAEAWRHTSADELQSHLGHDYAPEVIQRPEIESSGEIGKANLPIRVPVDFPVALLFRLAAPAEVILLRIHRKHRGDADAVVIFVGRVVNCDWTGREAVLQAESVYTSIRTTGLRRMYAKQCPHMLYGTACRVDPDGFASTGTLTSVSGVSLVVYGAHASSAGYWAGGILLWVDGDGRGHRRMIEDHGAAGAVRLLSPIPGLPTGASVQLWPGCDHTKATCANRFDNRLNYGGFPGIPGVNPISSPIF